MRISRLLVGVLIALVADSAGAAPKPVAPMNLAMHLADFSVLPTGGDLARYYPDRASRMGIEGSVVLQCSVAEDGTMQACAVLSETPPDNDFGQAAMKLSAIMRMKPRTHDGIPTAGKTICIPIHFEEPHVPPPPPSDQLPPLHPPAA